MLTPKTARTPEPDDLVDLAPFASVRWWAGTEGRDLQVHDLTLNADGSYMPARQPETGEWHLGLEWSEPQAVEGVSVCYAEGQAVPSDLRVEYWRKNWPTIAPERLRGARRGWIGQDDPWHGAWTQVRAEKKIDANRCHFRFDRLDLAEVPHWRQLDEAEDYAPRFRRTLKVRLVCGEAAPTIQSIEALSCALWAQASADIRFLTEQDWSGSVEIAGGYLLEVEPLLHVTLAGALSWQCPSGDGRLRVSYLYAKGDRARTMRTIITVHAAARSFSFLASDLPHGPICIKDYGVLITNSEDATPIRDIVDRYAQAPKPLYDRVALEPEQSLQRALAEIPPLDVTNQDSYRAYQEDFGLYMIMGVPGGRQEFALRYNGELFISKPLLKPAGRDLARVVWPGMHIRFRFGTGDPPDFREGRAIGRQSCRDGWMPIFTTEWRDRELAWTQTAFAALLDGPMTAASERRGDEDMVAMMRFTVRNATAGAKRACLWLDIDPPEQFFLQGRCILGRGRVVPDLTIARQWRVQRYLGSYVRCVLRPGRGRVDVLPQAAGAGSQAVNTAVRYQVDLAEGDSHSLDLAVPFASLTMLMNWKRFSELDFDEKLEDVAAFWQKHVSPGGAIDLPDRILNDLHKAVQTHVAISADKDPASGLTVLPPATWSYGACGNEATWQITMLDQAGHHKQAEDYLETFLQTQGAVRPDGRFLSASGSLQGLDLDDGKPKPSQFGYNLDHGTIMECLATHYRLSGDQAWLQRVTPHLLAACEFVVRERQATKTQTADGQPAPEWGLLPAGHLEDNPEWRHWFSVNAHAYKGLAAVATILAENGHPEGARLQQEAEAYREDIRRAARLAMVESPVVPLRDGTYIPHVPTRTGLRGRESGWFREAAYGPLHLLEGDVFAPSEEEMTWVLKDLEDNLFVSREWGRPVDVERYWFSHGGVTIQSNLMDLAIDYLRRGQVEHALRSLWNNLGSHLYPDVRVFTEHPVIELGHGLGPFYKSSDESKFLLWLRACLLMEEGEDLHVAPGAPRGWFGPGQTFAVERMATEFGPISYRCRASAHHITMRIEAPGRRSCRNLIVHLRPPERAPLRQITVNGEKLTADAVAESISISKPSGQVVIEGRY